MNFKNTLPFVWAFFSNKMVLIALALVIGVSTGFVIKSFNQPTEATVEKPKPTTTLQRAPLPEPQFKGEEIANDDSSEGGPIYVVETSDDGQTKTGSGFYQDNVRTGYWEFYHPNGQMSSVGEMKGGERVGVWRFYYANNQISSEGRYSTEGQKHGLWTKYWPSGQREFEGRYNNGVKEGQWQYWPYDGHADYFWQGSYNTQGRRHLDWRWYSGGKLRLVESFDNGRQTRRMSYNGGFRKPATSNQ